MILSRFFLPTLVILAFSVQPSFGLEKNKEKPYIHKTFSIKILGSLDRPEGKKTKRFKVKRYSNGKGLERIDYKSKNWSWTRIVNHNSKISYYLYQDQKKFYRYKAKEDNAKLSTRTKIKSRKIAGINCSGWHVTNSLCSYAEEWIADDLGLPFKYIRHDLLGVRKFKVIDYKPEIPKEVSFEVPDDYTELTNKENNNLRYTYRDFFY